MHESCTRELRQKFVCLCTTLLYITYYTFIVVTSYSRLREILWNLYFILKKRFLPVDKVYCYNIENVRILRLIRA